MNLLIDKWIPVYGNSGSNKVSLSDILIGEESFSDVYTCRDDLDVALLHLLIGITAYLFQPDSRNEWSNRVKIPISKEEYTRGIQKHSGYFNLFDDEYPFMQNADLKPSNPMSLEKMLLYPSGNNATFHMPNAKVSGLCSSCIIIAMTRQAVFGPPNRGAERCFNVSLGSLYVFVRGDDLRETIWLNIPDIKSFDPSGRKTNNFPTWVDSPSYDFVEKDSLGRGMLWCGENWKIGNMSIGKCSLCGEESDSLCTEMQRSQILIKTTGNNSGHWSHPCIPVYMVKKKDKEGDVRPKVLDKDDILMSWDFVKDVFNESTFVLEYYKSSVLFRNRGVFDCQIGGCILGNHQSGVEAFVCQKNSVSRVEKVPELIDFAIKYRWKIQSKKYLGRYIDVEDKDDIVGFLSTSFYHLTNCYVYDVLSGRIDDYEYRKRLALAFIEIMSKYVRKFESVLGLKAVYALKAKAYKEYKKEIE